MFIKREAKATLVENFTVALEVEKDLLSIGTLEHDSREETKSSYKKTQDLASNSSDKDNDSFDFEGLAKSLKQLANEVSELKRKTSEASWRSKSTKPFF